MYSLENKFIFTHPPKCGGTSVEEILGFLKLRDKFPNVHDFKHGTLEMHINKIQSKVLKSSEFFKFSIIRNPWERAVSFYNHNRHKTVDFYINETDKKQLPDYVIDAQNMTFKEFALKHYKYVFNSEVSTKPYMYFKGKFYIDYVVRLESIYEDLFRIKDKLKIELNRNIPHMNNSDRFVERKPYVEYYDTESKILIGKLFKWDIETFNYTY